MPRLSLVEAGNGRRNHLCYSADSGIETWYPVLPLNRQLSHFLNSYCVIVSQNIFLRFAALFCATE